MEWWQIIILIIIIAWVLHPVEKFFERLDDLEERVDDLENKFSVNDDIDDIDHP